jgi:hypothetical protein
VLLTLSWEKAAPYVNIKMKNIIGNLWGRRKVRTKLNIGYILKWLRILSRYESFQQEKSSSRDMHFERMN